ncbi:MAG: ATP-binding cassette domain-containing protein [Sphingobacteriales bacterium]|nr:MAG: ATP-binding cassette domain-containing protein [Sphingobacteriales bacterium]
MLHFQQCNGHGAVQMFGAVLPAQKSLLGTELPRDKPPMLLSFHPESQIKEMCARLGIDTKLHQLASKCSYGEQQRAAIVRCLQQPFEFLLLDEPFSHLDNNNSRLALQLILEEVEKRNAAMIMADLEPNADFPATKTLRL